MRNVELPSRTLTNPSPLCRPRFNLQNLALYQKNLPVSRNARQRRVLSQDFLFSIMNHGSRQPTDSVAPPIRHSRCRCASNGVSVNGRTSTHCGQRKLTMIRTMDLVYRIIALGLLGVAEHRGWSLNSVNEIKNVPKSVRDNPGSYRSVYGYYHHYTGGK